MLLEVTKLHKKAKRRMEFRFGKRRLENCVECKSYSINSGLQIRGGEGILLNST